MRVELLQFNRSIKQAIKTKYYNRLDANASSKMKVLQFLVILGYSELQKHMKNSKHNSGSSGITVLQRKKYSCFCKIFCCKCMYCCQSFDFSLLTSEHRKEVFFKMIKKYIKSIENESDTIIDPFFILVGLLLGQQNDEINTVTLFQMGDSTANQAIFSKEDLELYIPQLCTYLVFHEEMQNIPIFNLLEKTARMDLQFSLIYYCYMKSLETINENTEFKVVMKYNKTFKKKIDQHFKFYSEPISLGEEESAQIIEKYNHRNQASQKTTTFPKLALPPPHKIYRACLQTEDLNSSSMGETETNYFQSSLNFLNDLIYLGDLLHKSQNRKSDLQQGLRQINNQLPADVYLPFRSKKYRFSKIAGICFQQCKIFATKQRAPYYICLQVYESRLKDKEKKDRRVKSTTELDSINLRRSQLFQQDTVTVDYEERSDTQFETDRQIELNKKQNWLSKIYELAEKAKDLYGNGVDEQKGGEYHTEEEENQTLYLFGESQQQQFERIKAISPFGELQKYKLIHLMVKTNDDLRQESFAMQLLQEFNHIFKMESLPIHVIPYEVVPLGPNAGIIEFLKDTLTIDELRRREGDLSFIQKDPKKLRTFVHTLVGYSLVNYFLQVKDRHNGNILIKKDGSIINIDFGFFMSNSPGKGVELEKNMAFKMTAEYIETMGGLKSKTFAEFRKLFYMGYQACRKHQHRILILTKLMFSSHGTTMPCFIKGNVAIENLEQRLNPRGIRTDGDLSLLCQNLVNKTIDNWRARWYDKWQYYAQGIFY